MDGAPPVSLLLQLLECGQFSSMDSSIQGTYQWILSNTHKFRDAFFKCETNLKLSWEFKSKVPSPRLRHVVSEVSEVPITLRQFIRLGTSDWAKQIWITVSKILLATPSSHEWERISGLTSTSPISHWPLSSKLMPKHVQNERNLGTQKGIQCPTRYEHTSIAL